MKITFLLILLIPLFAIGQSKPHYKQIITAYEINKKDTINKQITTTFLDSLRKIITTEDNILNAISGGISKIEKTHSIIEVDSDSLYISAEIDKKGNVVQKIIYIYDDKKNRTENYQVINEDTITGQKRVYNELGKCTKVYNKKDKSHKYFLFNETEYDSSGNPTQEKLYNESGKLIEIEKYENVYNGKEFIITTYKSTGANDFFVKQSKTIKNDNTATSYFYFNSIGYNYGIKIRYVFGGMAIVEQDENGNMKEWKIFDNNKNLIVYVKNTEVKLRP